MGRGRRTHRAELLVQCRHGEVNFIQEEAVGDTKLVRGPDPVAQGAGELSAAGGGWILVHARAAERDPGVEIGGEGEDGASAAGSARTPDGQSEVALPALHGADTLSHVASDFLPGCQHGWVPGRGWERP
jgi:hypothetical protein